MKKQNVRTISLIVATLTYLLIGAAIFDKIESEEELNQSVALKAEVPSVALVDFLLMEEAVLLYKPYKAGKPWKFAGSFYYATTVLTSIGYGHSTPKTPGGKIFTMIYATIGIPLGLVMFNSIGERLNKFSSLVINSLRRSFKTKQEETTEVDLILVVMFLSAIIMGTGATAFSHYEVKTTWFGDLVALQQDNALEEKPEYVTFALFFIMFGLAVIAAVLNLMVLKFMTMNTEDEKRDEIEAIQAARHSVRVEGDVIIGDILSDPRYRESAMSNDGDDIRSVCSCNCTSCNPFFSKQKPGGRVSPPINYSEYLPSPPRSRPSSVHDMRSVRLHPINFNGETETAPAIVRDTSEYPSSSNPAYMINQPAFSIQYPANLVHHPLHPQYDLVHHPLHQQAHLDAQNQSRPHILHNPLLTLHNPPDSQSFSEHPPITLYSPPQLYQTTFSTHQLNNNPPHIIAYSHGTSDLARSHPRIITPEGHFYLYSSTDPVLDWSLREQSSYLGHSQQTIGLNTQTLQRHSSSRSKAGSGAKRGSVKSKFSSSRLSI
ncbi:two pore potassium channel protein sup-9 [Eurytemora carolleeae]|uniref:two pore potassium channel protein sup-9 n=1 Tax=Eurytemora carolleeae TaxID=1294199 RepID=UPI000C7775FD|nr:two pore potassium channel protein sup-9 [Eurytemora carolleeae]|eukprot:XP_023335038.1 two pore potassium channel protein sup-9-like [Eurytemora affinis]